MCNFKLFYELEFSHRNDSLRSGNFLKTPFQKANGWNFPKNDNWLFGLVLGI